MKIAKAVCRRLRPLWPRTLFAQVLVIMVGGTLAVQLLSSSIWFDVRFAQVLETPVRLMASRAAPLAAQDACLPGESSPSPTRYITRCLENRPLTPEQDERVRHRIELLLYQALAYELGYERPVHVIDFALNDELGRDIVWDSLFGLRIAHAHVHFALPLADGHWLEVEGQELQGWSGESAWILISDYLLRVYALRILAVLGICLLAVRLCLNPLKRLSEAAQGLGRNLEQPPLPLSGPLEVRQAAQAFNTMQQRLIGMLDDQSYFMAAVSHDLRTPLTRMRLRIERIADEQQRERLRQNIAEMEGMIAQVLDYLRCAEDQRTQPVDFDALLASVCTELAQDDEPLPVTGQAGMVEGNPLMLQRCLQNLLTNALRYARTISLCLETDDDSVTLHIEDRGPGIDEQRLVSITEPFVRGEESRNPQSGGYGLGLSIAKRVAQGHGGQLILHNRIGGGLCASLTLARHPPHPET
ncbi:HAMP domain-containing protein [Pseudomonas sp. ABC1]|uniref:ATP-binding protein n=1 Tax=Pseudomonas sp. ABC1 TaxID=2748080 RepID=UPI0015C310B7|nr:ATP-binding protein [Pseudomonas sp. ABC1]QLF93707.1 HAMP domain-containing protein [Pseudomonas sp. ABC1]